MSSVSGAGNTPAGTSIFSATTKSPSSASDPSNDLGKDDFMKLMLAQLQNQDPMQPEDNTQFLAQTAQFNTLEQIVNLNKTMSAVLDAQQLGQASALIGKTVAATDANDKSVTGAVTGATIESGVAKLHLGNTVVDLDKVTAVAADAKSLPSTTPTGDAPTEETPTYHIPTSQSVDASA